MQIQELPEPIFDDPRCDTRRMTCSVVLGRRVMTELAR